MKIIENFLNGENFLKLSNIMLDQKFPWYFNNSKSEEKDNDYQFVHIFFYEGKILSPYWNFIVPIIDQLNIETILRIKANLTTRTDINRKSQMHIDVNVPNSKTAVYYPNTNNGGTLFQNGKKINSQANKIIIFDSHQKHCGVHCTDKNVRLVINFNYLKKK